LAATIHHVAVLWTVNGAVMVSGAREILFKISGAVVVVPDVGHQLQFVAGAIENYCFTVTYGVFGAKFIGEYF